MWKNKSLGMGFISLKPRLWFYLVSFFFSYSIFWSWFSSPNSSQILRTHPNPGPAFFLTLFRKQINRQTMHHHHQQIIKTKKRKNNEEKAWETTKSQTHKSTKLETIIFKQKSSKTENAHSKWHETEGLQSALEFILRWSSMAVMGSAFHCG